MIEQVCPSVDRSSRRPWGRLRCPCAARTGSDRRPAQCAGRHRERKTDEPGGAEAGDHQRRRERGAKWFIVPVGDGKTLRGTYIVANHTVVVDIVPGSSSYSLKYADSINMKYGVENGKPVIHPFYNDWVDQLIRAIDCE